MEVNGLNGEIVELEAQTLPSVLQDVDYACINGNYALSTKVTDKCLVTESTESDIAQTNANIIAVKKGNEDLAKVKALVECLKSKAVSDFIKEKYGAAVIPML